MSSQQLSPLSACVTRILALSGFSPSLKTRDFQQAFSDWENVMGGFKIKWINDTSLYIVFQDATVAKRAYLQALYSPPPILLSPTSAQLLPQIRPYDGPDAQSVIQAVNARGGGGGGNGGGASFRGHASRASIAVGGGINGAHARHGSGAMALGRLGMGMGVGMGGGGMGGGIGMYDSPSTTTSSNTFFGGREPSPTLPNLPSQPTLNSLISSSLGGENSIEGVDENSRTSIGNGGPPKIGDPGKRMVAHSLGVRHPGLNRSHSGGDLNAKIRELQAGMQGVSVAE